VFSGIKPISDQVEADLKTELTIVDHRNKVKIHSLDKRQRPKCEQILRGFNSEIALTVCCSQLVRRDEFGRCDEHLSHLLGRLHAKVGRARYPDVRHLSSWRLCQSHVHSQSIIAEPA
jgi:hypothetical protein